MIGSLSDDDGVLGALGRPGLRPLAALFLLAAWPPLNLGLRPERITTERSHGGAFLALCAQSRPGEVPSRLVGEPDVEWGHVELFDHGLAVDAIPGGGSPAPSSGAGIDPPGTPLR